MPYKMDDQRKQILDALVSYVKKKANPGQVQLLENFICRYYEMVSIDDIQSLAISELYNLAKAHWDMLFKRQPGELIVKVYNPSLEQDGWQSTHTVLQVSYDDMPFLLDSIRMEINRLGFLVHLVLHVGGLNVLRDKKHQVTKILSVGSYNEKASSEAIIYLEIDRQTDPGVLKEIEQNIRRVLTDVFWAVRDWGKMRERLQEVLLELEEEKLPADPSEVAESKDFLRWIDSDHFTYLGVRDYIVVGEGDQKGLQIVRGSGLGVLSDDTHSKELRKYADMPEEARKEALSSQILIIAKTNTHATVHRPAYTDYIGVKRFNKQGKIIGERRFIGLYTSVAYNANPRHIPFLRHKVAQVMKMSHLSPSGHAGKALLNILETIPRDDLFQTPPDDLLKMAIGILQLQERQRTRIFVRKDSYGRFYSCLVYVPRERFNTEVRQAFEEILKEAFQAKEITFSTRFSDSILARVHFIVRVDPALSLSYDLKKIEANLIKAARSWKDDLKTELISEYGEEKGILFYNQFQKTFPVGYQEFYPAKTAVHDIVPLQKLTHQHSLEMDFHLSPDGRVLRFKVFNTEGTMPLSDILPMLENMGLRLIGERPFRLHMPNGTVAWINDFDMAYSEQSQLDIKTVRVIFQEAFRNIWMGFAENDNFNRLVLKAKLPWRKISVLRALAKYLRQVGFTFSQAYIEEAMANHPGIAAQLVELFEVRFDPDYKDSRDYADNLRTAIEEALESVKNRDEDRILRRYLDIIFAILRTNFYQKTEDGLDKDYLSFKFDPESIPDLPLPKPMYEIFVYSTRVEGVHLRSSKVARGGLRWSDRREDFRTEILGLMKAQQVKNAVIVPSGAKGGFVAKQLPTEGGRELILEEVIRCYRTFISGLLDLTDNLEGEKIIFPDRVVRYDDEDTYLVVAADKGTAAFSDIANSIARDYNYWLDDAFASGGSVGYDHKKMGITARGAWVSVRRNFLELGLNTQTTDFTVVGIGDMSGDVFGNGMLQSPHIKLLGAFNHLHVFVDPNPNARKSYKERRRLFNLPRSSWSDYDAALISKGGGVFNRSDKFILLSDEIKEAFDIEKDRVEPDELIRAMLTAKVDLLWNGGIGTFVKAENESHEAVGDRTNDSLRVNADQLRCRVVGEGGNLGFTQLGRVEYALQGGSIYTDFIDNSAGVDCSDHEVNIKILLNNLIAQEKMSENQRVKLLSEMTQEVAELVLQNNYEQSLAISAATLRSFEDIDIYRRHINSLESLGKIDRKLEFLPDDNAILERKASRLGLTKPEVSILFAYAKNILNEEILLSDLPEDEFFLEKLKLEFPFPLQRKFYEEMKSHSLRREIIATQITNNIINRTGVNFVHRLQQETGVSSAEVVRAYTMASHIFPVEEVLQDIAALDYQIDPKTQFSILTQVSLLIRRVTRWFVRNRQRFVDIQDTIEHFEKPVKALIKILSKAFIQTEEGPYVTAVKSYLDRNVSQEVAEKIALIPLLFFALEIVDAVSIYNFSLEKFVYVYFALGERFYFDWVREQIKVQQADNYWEELSRSLLLDDLDWQQRQLTVSVLQFEPKRRMIAQQLEDWIIMNDLLVTRWMAIYNELKTSADHISLIMFSVALRELFEFSQFGARPVRQADLVKPD